MTAVDGYYLNSLREWRKRLLADHRKIMARYASLERQMHPSKHGQGKLMELNAAMIALVDAALAEGDAADAGG